MTATFTRRTAFTAVAALAGAGLARAATAQSRTGGAPNLMYAGLGLKGYDPVAYVTDGKPARGSEAFTTSHNGLTWRFATAAHLAMFEKEPAKFLPLYGGFCAWGVAQGKLFDIDPATGWMIADRKLYVFFNADILKLFRAEQAALTARAEQNWPKLNV